MIWRIDFIKDKLWGISLNVLSSPKCEVVFTWWLFDTKSGVSYKEPPAFHDGKKVLGRLEVNVELTSRDYMKEHFVPGNAIVELTWKVVKFQMTLTVSDNVVKEEITQWWGKWLLYLWANYNQEPP